MTGLLADPLRHLVGHGTVLGDVRVALRAGGVVHRHRDGVGDEQHVRVATGGVAQVGERGQRRVHHRLHEARVVEVVPQPVEPRCTRAHGVDRVGEVLAVLPAAGVRRVGARHQAGGPGDPVLLHLLQRVREVGVPVAVAPVDRQVDARGREVLLDGADEGPVLVVDRAAAAEEVVVLAHLLEPLARDAPSRVTFSRNGSTSSGLSGPPKETSSSASYGEVSRGMTQS